MYNFGVVSKEAPLILVFFGLPGSGKSTAGKIAEESGFYLYNADQDYTTSMQAAMRNNLPIQEEDRDVYYKIVAQRVKTLQKDNPRLVVDHWFPRDRHRIYIQEQIPQAQFVLITTPSEVRVDRLMSGNRKSPIPNTDPEYYVKVARIFEEPTILHKILFNDTTLGNFSDKIKQLFMEFS